MNSDGNEDRKENDAPEAAVAVAQAAPPKDGWQCRFCGWFLQPKDKFCSGCGRQRAAALGKPT